MTVAGGQPTSKSGSLPPEVLSGIFQECLEPDVLYSVDCTIPNPLEAPLVLTWVCRHWRSIALNTHRLWAGITLVRKPDRINDSTRLLDLWIERSGKLPFGVRFADVVEDADVVLSIHNRIDINPLQSDGLRAFISTLLKCSNRWRVLEMVVPDVSFAIPLLDAVTAKARGLEHLCISSKYLGINEAPYRYNFSQNTALQTVRLVTPQILPFPNASHQTFVNLTVLELHFCASIESCLTWLDMTPNLESLVLRLFSMRQQESIFRPRRRMRALPRLDCLEITCYAAASQEDDPSSILEVLELPTLTDLELDYNHMFDASPFPQIRDMLIRSGANLERLCLSGTHMSEGEIVECLRLSPELEWLECEIVSDGILQALTPRLVSEEPEAISTSPRPVQTPEVRTESEDNNNDARTASPDAEDVSRYTVMCPKLSYFEAADVDACSLQAIHAMVASRCEDVYKVILVYVDTSAIIPTPDAFKTLHSIVLPCSPVFGVLSHPRILEDLERVIYF